MVTVDHDAHRSVDYAESNDLPSIQLIENACFQSEIRETPQTFEDRLLSFPDGFFVLKETMHDALDTAKLVAGYFCSEIWTSTPSESADSYLLNHTAGSTHNPSGTILYISSFAVHPAAQGGAGRFLFNSSISSIISRFPHIRQIQFIVSDNWHAARHIYETEGFVYKGVIPDFFKTADGVHSALIMSKTVY